MLAHATADMTGLAIFLVVLGASLGVIGFLGSFRRRD